MKSIKYKYTLFIPIFLSLIFCSVFLRPEVASASSLTYNIACNDGSSELTISKNNSKHETTVKCKSGAKFDYSASGDEATARVVGSCPDPEVPGTEVDAPNKATSKLVFYCLQGPVNPDRGTPTRTDSTPTVKDETNKLKEDQVEDPDEDGGGLEPSPLGTDYDSTDCTGGLGGGCKLVDLIVTITNVASGLAATVIVAMIIIGGIQYSMAGAEAAKVQAAKQKIINALLALMLLIFGFSIIQWLVPGGLI